MAKLYNVTAYQQFPLQAGWELLSTTPGRYQCPEQLEQIEQKWLAASVPGTVIEVLQKNQLWDLAHPYPIDTMDWWYRCSFEMPGEGNGAQIALKFAGLATVAEIWLNARLILTTDNMFRAYEADITAELREHNMLYIRFSALEPLLAQKRPRPRWRTQLVAHQQLRWLRTTLLGRMPGWSPPVQAVGPWRSICIEERRMLALEQLTLQTRVQGDDGYVTILLQAQNLAVHTPTQATFIIDEKVFPLDIQYKEQDIFVLRGDVCIPMVQRWWPHTHGSQHLYAAKIVLQYPETVVELACGRLAFRHIELLDTTGKNFGIRVNGIAIFCRGACWTPLDIFSLSGTYPAYVANLQMAQRAGINMLRVSGTMIYENDCFYDLCDELGILIWQDFMFANMDYPTSDRAFRANCRQECEQLLERLQTHACLAVLCGNSEIQQQVAMLGLTQEMWSDEYFEQILPEICQRYVDIPYWISSPGGGALPFQVNTGNAHYQGVGAFLRPLEDARTQRGTLCDGMPGVCSYS